MSENQLLLFGDETLLNGKMLWDYQIHAGSVIGLNICKDQGDTDAILAPPSPPLAS